MGDKDEAVIDSEEDEQLDKEMLKKMLMGSGGIMLMNNIPGATPMNT